MKRDLRKAEEEEKWRKGQQGQMDFFITKLAVQQSDA